MLHINLGEIHTLSVDLGNENLFIKQLTLQPFNKLCLSALALSSSVSWNTKNACVLKHSLVFLFFRTWYPTACVCVHSLVLHIFSLTREPSIQLLVIASNFLCMCTQTLVLSSVWQENLRSIQLLVHVYSVWYILFDKRICLCMCTQTFTGICT